MVPWSRQNKLWFGRSFPFSLRKLASDPRPLWFPLQGKVATGCFSIREPGVSIKFRFRFKVSSKLIQPAQERNRVDWFVVRLMCVGGWSSWQALGATSVEEPVTQEGSLTLLSVRGWADQTRLLADYVGFKESWTRQRQAEKCFKEGKWAFTRAWKDDGRFYVGWRQGGCGGLSSFLCWPFLQVTFNLRPSVKKGPKKKRTYLEAT